jgi:hypothetical protein
VSEAVIPEYDLAMLIRNDLKDRGVSVDVRGSVLYVVHDGQRFTVQVTRVR